MIKKIKIASLLFFLWFAVHAGVITCDGLHDNLGKVDAGIVLGNKVEEDGQASDRLKSRLDRACELYDKKYFSRIIVSGGTDPGGFDEADVMKRYLVMKGIPGGAIIADAHGTTTMHTARNAKEILLQHDLKTVMVITQFYHISRTRLAFSMAGMRNVPSARARIFELRDVYSIMREFFAFYRYLWFL